MNFTELIKNNVKPNQKIDNWSYASGYNLPVKQYEFVKCCDEKIIMRNPDTSEEYTVEESDFQFLWENWKDYTSGITPRNELRDENMRTSYTICLMHYLDLNGLITKE